MADKNYGYYSYLKKYSPFFIHKYECGVHASWGRGSQFLRMVEVKYALNLSQRVILFWPFTLKSPVVMFGAAFCCVNLWGIWYFQEIYNKYSIHKWTHYQPKDHKDNLFSKDDVAENIDPFEERKPYTRMRMGDRVKMVYDGEEQRDVIARRRLRYR